MAKTDKGWYIESGRYAEDLEREIRGAEDRLSSLEQLGAKDEPAYAQAEAALSAATAALKKLKPAPKAKKK